MEETRVLTSGVDPIKKMAELLKAGAAMLAETCPVEGCNLPLFKLPSGELVCPVHGRVYLARTDEEIEEIKEEVTIKSVLDRLENRVLETINKHINEPSVSPRELIDWLEILERVRRIKSLVREK